MDLIADTKRYMAITGIGRPGDPLLVAVSGGVDSMVLLHVLLDLGHPCTVAHVDHGLRGIESDADREFVREQCAILKVPYREHRCDVAAVAREKGISKLMAARELRYAWFRELLQGEIPTLALGHHADDAIETLFIGLMQGMGLKGWRTIPPVTHVSVQQQIGHVPRDAPKEDQAEFDRGVFVRPLLHADRSAIEAFAQARGIPFREDGSNADTNYLRNRIRHDLIPLLEEWRPGSRRVLKRNVTLLRDLADVAEDALIAKGTHAKKKDANGSFRIPFHVILEHAAPQLMLRHLLKDLGFHQQRLEELFMAIQQGATGDRFPAQEGEVWVDRDALIITEHHRPTRSWIVPALHEVPFGSPVLMHAARLDEIDAVLTAEVAWFDAEALEFPLTIRPWEQGDRMRPIGLDGSKLVSDILIDAKVSGPRKQEVHVLVSAGTIVWLCGMRIAEGFQGRPDSSALIRAEWLGAS